MAAEWSVPLGIVVFIVAIILAAFLFIKNKRLSHIGFVAAIATYVFAVFYTWDVFELQRNWVMLLLVFSTLLMIAVGKYFDATGVLTKTPKKRHSS